MGVARLTAMASGAFFALAACAGLPGGERQAEAPGSAPARDPAAETARPAEPRYSAPEPSWRARPAPRRATASTVEGAVAYGVPAEAALAAINDLRSEAGLSPLTLDTQLSAAALAHTQDLAERGEVSALSEGGLGVIGRLRRVGVEPFAASSLVAGGYPTVEEAIEVWTTDPVEKARLLLPAARSAGIARAEDPATPYRWYIEVILADL